MHNMHITSMDNMHNTRVVCIHNTSYAYSHTNITVLLLVVVVLCGYG